jgi:hypothetical protein
MLYAPFEQGFCGRFWRDALQRAAGSARELRRAFVATTVRFYYDTTIAVALTTVFALVVALIAAVIVGGNGPNAAIAIVVFVLTGAILLFLWRRGWLRSGSRPPD